MNSGADPGFHARGGALENIAPSGGRCEHFWGISCEKCPILGGGGRRVRPPLDPPLELHADR
jgi:hypothetical protein